MQNQLLNNYKKVYQKPNWKDESARKVIAVDLELHSFIKEECANKKMKMNEMIREMIDCYKSLNGIEQ